MSGLAVVVAEQLLEAAAVDVVDDDDVGLAGEQRGEHGAGGRQHAAVAGVAPRVAVDAGHEHDVGLLLVVVEARVLVDVHPGAAVLAHVALAPRLDLIVGPGPCWVRHHRHFDTLRIALPGIKEILSLGPVSLLFS